MFFFLSKTITYLILPFSLVWLFLLQSIIHTKRRKLYSIFGFGLLTIFSLPAGVHWAFSRYEYPISPIENVSFHRLGIVLGGAGHVFEADTNRIFLNASANRVLDAVQLYKMGKIEKIVYTGGAGNLMGKKLSEAVYIHKFLKQMGIPDSAILMEKASRNTYENALFTRNLLKKENLASASKLLITSGYHMKRSMACFEKQGLKCTPFSTEPKLSNRPYAFDAFLPNAESFMLWNTLLHEWIGMISYKAAGYI
jgi:uncharacterized SAM-binding protein YcdF (DUF218 family)